MMKMGGKGRVRIKGFQGWIKNQCNYMPILLVQADRFYK